MEANTGAAKARYTASLEQIEATADADTGTGAATGFGAAEIVLERSPMTTATAWVTAAKETITIVVLDSEKHYRSRAGLDFVAR